MSSDPFVLSSILPPLSHLLNGIHRLGTEAANLKKSHFSVSVTVFLPLCRSELSVAGGQSGPQSVRACLSVTLHCPFNPHTHTFTLAHRHRVASKGAVAWERQCNYRPLYQHCIVVCVGLLFYGQLVVIGTSSNRELPTPNMSTNLCKDDFHIRQDTIMPSHWVIVDFYNACW